MSTTTHERRELMALAKQRTNDDLMAELNADLRARDPMQVMKRQMRLRLLDEMRHRVTEMRMADTRRADLYLQLEEIINELQ